MLTMTNTDKDFFNRTDKIFPLDEEQKAIVLNDDNCVYVVAGAGSGKSTVLSRKIQYLIEVKKIDPKEILVLSFTNKSIEDLENKIKEITDEPIEVKTFHSEGLNLYLKETGNNYKNPKKYSLSQSIKSTFYDEILKDKNLTKKVILFFSSYMYIPFQYGDMDLYCDYLFQNDFSTIRQDIEPQQNYIKQKLRNQKTDIKGERMESKEEVDIANFLYLNGINYEYEIPYITSFPETNRAYVPDFLINQNSRKIYIEHYGVTENGKNTRFSEKSLNQYNQHIVDKRELHKKNKTELIENYSEYNDGRSFIEHLEEDLKNKGIIFNKRDESEVLKNLLEAKKSIYLDKLFKLIQNFINNFYEMDYPIKKIDSFIKKAKKNEDERTLLFLEICKKCIENYEIYLSENKIIDFNHMIKNSTELLEQGKPLKYLKNIKYIIIDEYQDISKSRVAFIKAMVNYYHSKLLVVGDDWQSIYKFSGSDIKLFTNFKNHFPGAKRLLITHTYRNSQELINIAGNFVMKNKTQIKKKLISDKSIDDPINIYTYEVQYNSDIDFKTMESTAIANRLITILEKIREEYEGKCPPVLVLGRYNFDGEKLKDSGLFEYTCENNTYYLIPEHEDLHHMTIVYSTIHSAKGLGFENVVLINCKDDVYGLPCKKTDDPIMNLLSPGSESIDYAEERRLFYVAMTRTKNRFYIIAPYDKPSPFLLELTEDNKKVSVIGKPLESTSVKKELFKCPDCGAPLIFKENTELEIPLWICSNDSMSCGFVTNQLCSQHLRIKKCPCKKGYLIVKPITDKDLIALSEIKEVIASDPTKPKWYNRPYLLGCTEFKNGCRITMGSPISTETMYDLHYDYE